MNKAHGYTLQHLRPEDVPVTGLQVEPGELPHGEAAQPQAELIATNRTKLLLDMKSVDKFDSGALGTLVACDTRLHECGEQLDRFYRVPALRAGSVAS